MVQPGERRFTFRLYEDNPEDRELLRKMGTLLTDGKYRSKNEVLRRGIALVYETCYEVSGESRVSAGIAEHEIKEASRWIAEEVIRRIGEGIPAGLAGCSLPEETGKMTEEMASFLSGLNSEG